MTLDGIENRGTCIILYPVSKYKLKNVRIHWRRIKKSREYIRGIRVA